MINTIIFDFSRVLLFPKQERYIGGLNRLHALLKGNTGYSLLDNFELNTELLNYLDKIKGTYELYIFTTGSIQEEPEIKSKIEPIFKKVFTVAEIGNLKSDPQAFKEILERINERSSSAKKKPGEVLFVDDQEDNVLAAESIGIKSVQFKSNQQLFKLLSQI